MANHTENHDQPTSERLLEAAVAVFARRGYHEATVAEICDAAEANIAAVNYYFRSKENLYAEAWRHAYRRSAARYPPDGGVPPGAPAEERLRGLVLAIMRRIGDPECHEFEIVHKEMANPTGLLAGAMGEAIEPIEAAFRGIVRELAGAAVSEAVVDLCVTSIRTQCFGPMQRERRRRLMPGSENNLPVPPRLAVSVEAYADHVVRFSLAGIAAVCRDVRTAEETA